MLLLSGHHIPPLQKLSKHFTIGLHLAAISVNRLFLDSINPLFFYFYYEHSLSGCWFYHCSLMHQSWLKSPPARVSVTNIDTFHSVDNNLRCYRDASERHYRPPAVAPSNIIFLNVRRSERWCLIMTERTDYMPRNNAIISCVISPGEKARGREMKCDGRMLCVMHPSVW